MNKVLTRLKNPKVVLAVVSGVALILVNVGVIDMSMHDKALEIANYALGVGIAVGVFGNPESHVEK